MISAAVTVTPNASADPLRVTPQPGLLGRRGGQAFLDQPESGVGLDLAEVDR